MQNTPYRPTLPVDQKSHWENLIDVAREEGPEKVLTIYNNFDQETGKFEEYEEDGKLVVSSESERIKTLDELLHVADVDLDQFEVERHICNAWEVTSWKRGYPEVRTNHQVKAWLKKKYMDKPNAKYYQDWIDSVSKVVDKTEYKVSESSDEVVLMFADLHLGGVVKEEGFQEYDIDEAIRRLDQVAATINEEYKGKKVHVKMLGDAIESFSGKNHKDTWLYIEQHGMEVALTAFRVIRDFLLKLEGLGSFDIVGGNHDRVTAANDEDNKGGVAFLVAELLKELTIGVQVRFHHRVLTAIHDNICYIVTHGDKKITKMEPAKMILEYGQQGMFNVMANAHGHEEKIHDTSVDYISIQIPPITVPNHFALDLGKTSPSGYVSLQQKNNKVDRKIHSL